MKNFTKTLAIAAIIFWVCQQTRAEEPDTSLTSGGTTVDLYFTEETSVDDYEAKFTELDLNAVPSGLLSDLSMHFIQLHQFDGEEAQDATSFTTRQTMLSAYP